MYKGRIGIKEIADDPQIAEQPYYASVIDEKVVEDQFTVREIKSYTTLELQFILAIRSVLESVDLKDFSRLLLLISTTKGNIELLEKNENRVPEDRIYLPVMAAVINDYFKFPNDPLVVSNACISGVSALMIAKKMIKKGTFDHVLVVGGDSFNEFVYSGFQSFLALSQGICKPYDKHRDGINLGEGVAGILVSNNPGICSDQPAFSEIVGGGQANDANHISGPSREGRGLRIAVEKAVKEAGIQYKEIGYINAHGTATLFNDEMESIAFSSLGLGENYLNSLKGYFGHTLGAAGVLESVFTIRQMNTGKLLQSQGYKEPGVSNQLMVLETNKMVDNLQYALKTASGFGGGNAAIIFKKIWN